MKTLTIVILCIFSANGRLIDKNNTEKNDETSPTEPTSPVRVSRQAFYDYGIGVSGEESVAPHEVFRPYIRRGRYSIKSKSRDTQVTKADKQTKDTTDVTKAGAAESEETKKTLVKKPIPKFNDVDYEDFQGKINKSPLKYADSGEHEDEDFNLDDYEFDVNHDEYAGRGKPLEPRTKLKVSKGNPEKKTPNTRHVSVSPPEIKMQSKVVIPSQPLVRTKNGISKKAAHKMKDYYDDIITTTKAPEVEVKSEDEFSDDAEESKELNNKNLMRMARSPGLVEMIASKMGDKTASVMSLVKNSLPYILRHEVYPIDSDDIGDLVSHPMIDPLTGDRFMF